MVWLTGSFEKQMQLCGAHTLTRLEPIELAVVVVSKANWKNHGKKMKRKEYTPDFLLCRDGCKVVLLINSSLKRHVHPSICNGSEALCDCWYDADDFWVHHWHQD